MKKIIEWLTSIGKDKWIHYSLCLIIALLAMILAKHQFPDMGKGELASIGWAAGFVAGLSKEIYDEIKNKSSDPYDWAADFLGSTSGTILGLLLI